MKLCICQSRNREYKPLGELTIPRRLKICQVSVWIKSRGEMKGGDEGVGADTPAQFPLSTREAVATVALRVRSASQVGGSPSLAFSRYPAFARITQMFQTFLKTL